MAAHGPARASMASVAADRCAGAPEDVLGVTLAERDVDLGGHREVAGRGVLAAAAVHREGRREGWRRRRASSGRPRPRRLKLSSALPRGPAPCSAPASGPGPVGSPARRAERLRARERIQGEPLGSRMAQAAQSLSSLVTSCSSMIFSSRTAPCSVPVIDYIRNTFLPHNERAHIASSRIYPCPPAYPWRCARPVGARRMQLRWKRRRETEILINIMCCTLSHIAVGFPRVALNGGRVGAPLNTSQRGLVSVCASRILSMRRVLTTCDSSASLIRLSEAGDDMMSCMSALELVPYARLRSRTPEPGQPLGGGTADGGRPGPLIASRIDLPDKVGEFDPGPFLSELSMQGLMEPDSLLIPDEELGPGLPKGRLASREELYELGRRWDSIDKCKLVKATEIDERDLADVFPVIKSGLPHPRPGIDRQIIDRRRRNARERRVVTGSKLMPNAMLLCDLHIPKGFALRFSTDDLRNFYHAFPGSWLRAFSTPVGYKYPAEVFKTWKCWRNDFAPGEGVYIAWSGLGMGDHNAVDWAQEMHLSLLQRAGLMLPENLLVYPRSIPRNLSGYYEGVMIDDRVGLQIYNKRRPGDASADQRSFAISDAAYLEAGLERHPKKARRQVDTGSFWGVEVEGRAGLVGIPRHKIACLMFLLLWFGMSGVATTEVLEMLAGQLAYALCFRRPLMAVLSHVYRQASSEGSRFTKYRMGMWACNELICAAMLFKQLRAFRQARS